MDLKRHANAAVAIAFAITSATTLVACVGSARMRAGVVYSDPVVYVDTVPDYLYAQPVVYYRGYPAYWVDNRWYYQSSRGWLVFQREPAQLYQHRVRVRPRPQARVQSHGRARVQPRGRARAQPQDRSRGQGRHDRRTRRD